MDVEMSNQVRILLSQRKVGSESPSRPDCGEVVDSGVANVDGPFGDRTQKPPRDFTEKPPTRPKRRLLGKRGCASQLLFIPGAAQ
jgi:hypothetical protein